jgi:hypothetical protein
MPQYLFGVLSAVMLRVASYKPNVVMLTVIMLGTVLPNVIMVSVVAPKINQWPVL